MTDSKKNPMLAFMGAALLSGLAAFSAGRVGSEEECKCAVCTKFRDLAGQLRAAREAGTISDKEEAVAFSTARTVFQATDRVPTVDEMMSTILAMRKERESESQTAADQTVKDQLLGDLPPFLRDLIGRGGVEIKVISVEGGGMGANGGAEIIRELFGKDLTDIKITKVGDVAEVSIRTGDRSGQEPS